MSFDKVLMSFDNVFTRMEPMPISIKAYVVAHPDASYTIVLNSNHSSEQNLKSYVHELQHILQNDYEKKCSANLIEIFAHI